MIIGSHNKGSERSHSRRKMKKEDAKENGKRMSQEEIDKEIVELKEQLSALRRMLEESQRLGWVYGRSQWNGMRCREGYNKSK